MKTILLAVVLVVVFIFVMQLLSMMLFFSRKITISFEEFLVQPLEVRLTPLKYSFFWREFVRGPRKKLIRAIALISLEWIWGYPIYVLIMLSFIEGSRLIKKI